MQAAGRRVPALDNLPPYRADLAALERAYADTSTDRNPNGGLRYSVVAEWCDRFSFPFADCWEILRIVEIGRAHV